MTPAIERINLKLLRDKLATAEAAGEAGVMIGTGHLRLLLQPIEARSQSPHGDPTLEALAAAAIIDVWMNGDQSWRTREGGEPSQEFMAGADWIMAVVLARAVLKVVEEAAHPRPTVPSSRP